MSDVQRTPRRRRAPLIVGVIGLGVLILSACDQDAPVTDPEPGVSASSAPVTAPTPSPTAEPARLYPEGGASDNLELFTAITQEVWDGSDSVSGRAYIDALVSAGFDREAMEVTADKTTLGTPVESLQFAVRWDEECLIGQVGPTVGDPLAIVAPGLADGGCLVGTTRAIDW